MDVSAAARVGLSVAFAAVVASTAISSQSPRPAPRALPGAITGVVVDAQSGAPVSGALIYLAHQGRGTVGRQSRQLTDSIGRFAFTDLASSNDYTLSTMAAGYFDGGYSQERTFGSRNVTLSLAPGQWMQDVKVPMWRGAAVSGRVTDETGEAVVNVPVRALGELAIAGATHLVSGVPVRTDDRGTYRISNLAPGRYKLLVGAPHNSVPFGSAQAAGAIPTPSEQFDRRAQLVIAAGNTPPPSIGQRRQAYPPAFFGGASIDQATVVEVSPGDERDGVDIQLIPGPVFVVSGVVEGPPDGRNGLLLRLMPRDQNELLPGSEVATTHTAVDGSFVFLDVPPGSYIVDAATAVGGYGMNPMTGALPELGASDPFWPFGRGVSVESVSGAPRGVTIATSTFFSGVGAPPGSEVRRRLSGHSTVDVGHSDVTGITVTLTPSASITGRMLFEHDATGVAAKPDLMTVSAYPADGDPSLTVVSNQLTGQDSDQFAIGGLFRGAYVLHGLATKGWTVKSIMYEGRDYIATPFDESSGSDRTGVIVTFTTRAPVITGRVHDDSGRTTSDAAVIAFPVEHEEWRNYGLEPARIQSVLTAPDGTFRITGMPAGTYNVVAVAATDADAWQMSDFFAKVESRASRVEVAWGDHKSTDLGVIR